MDKISIGTVGDWDVRVVPWPSYNERTAWWTVQVKHKDAKGGYWLNWNGKRFANGEPMRRLAEKNPELHKGLYEKFKTWSAS